MLETPSIRRYSPIPMGSDNASGADNQQERPARASGPESSETIRRTSRTLDEDMVPSAWRHAAVCEGIVQCMRRLRSLSKVISEIPCRVSSDLHEWRNELGAVSTRGSVKSQSR